VPLLLVMVLAMMVLPLPAVALDMLFTFNISLSLIILLVVLYTLRPLDFAVFPTVLLMATLLRLALNVASTRVVLLNGHTGTDAAGRVIEAFGEFVVGGSYTVGIVVFVILVIINFKFVRGDAIAGILILFINILGGLAVGTMQHGMALGEAARTYTLLTIGDGLVAQIPSLMLSTATAVIVTRISAEHDLPAAPGCSAGVCGPRSWRRSRRRSARSARRRSATFPGTTCSPWTSSGWRSATA